ncbi:MAG: MAE_28990/MAE_18760 family HEPN-like nuclease [Parvibaculaceae bacterium]
MDNFDRLGSVFGARIDEVLGNLRVRQAHLFFIRHQTELFAFGAIPEYLKNDFNRALNIKSAPETVAYRGLILQLYGAFERFVTEITEATLNAIQAKAKRYSELPEGLRNSHTVGSARLLTKLHDRTINGVPFDFASLQLNMAACFGDDENYRLGADAFTALLGVCTSERVDSVFEAMGIGKAFDDQLGKHPSVKSWAKGAGAREAFKLARDSLNELVRLRNQIAHNLADPEVLDAEVEAAADLLSALGKALIAKARLKTA